MNGGDNKTIYLGKGNNRVKIYNKCRESDLDYDLTRVEISSSLDIGIHDLDNFFYGLDLPDIYLNQYVYSFADMEKKNNKDIMYCILFALQEGYDINDLPRRYKEHVKLMLEAGYKINFSNEACTSVLISLIQTIFGQILI